MKKADSQRSPNTVSVVAAASDWGSPQVPTTHTQHLLEIEVSRCSPESNTEMYFFYKVYRSLGDRLLSFPLKRRRQRCTWMMHSFWRACRSHSQVSLEYDFRLHCECRSSSHLSLMKCYRCSFRLGVRM